MPALPFPAPPLAHETVLLRPWREADLPDNLMAFSDPVTEHFFCPQATPFTVEDAPRLLRWPGVGLAARGGDAQDSSIVPAVFG